MFRAFRTQSRLSAVVHKYKAAGFVWRFAFASLVALLTFGLTTSCSVMGVGHDGSAAQSSQLSATRPMVVPHYKKFDTKSFQKACDKFTKLAKAGDEAAVIKQYDVLYNKLAKLDDNANAAYLAYCSNINDETRSKQFTEAQLDSDNCHNAANLAFAAVCKGSCAQTFKKHVGQVAFDYYTQSEESTKRELDLDKQEAKLKEEYFSAINEADQDELTPTELNEKVGPIFVKLVKIRTELAKLNGYDNYADLADDVYLRDYEPEDLKKLYAAVKKIGPRFFELYYGSDASFAFTEEAPEQGLATTLNKLQSAGSKIDPVVSDSVELLKKHHLFDIGGDDDRMDGAFTTVFVENQVPFIYMKADGVTDLQTLSHEIGHFTDYRLNASPNNLVYGGGNLDISEIQANGLQALFTNFYDEIYGGELGKKAASANLMDQLTNVMDGCIYDEFQREVYTHPDMTLDEINKCYARIASEYGDETDDENAYWWQYVSHTFDSPLYYVSYATSGIAALQLWDNSQTDFKGACKTWREIIDAGCYNYGYRELMAKVKLIDLTDTHKVSKTCSDVLDYIERL